MKQVTFKFIIPAVFSMVFQPLFGQIVGQATDSNYYNTTVVYVKENTKGVDVLNRVENDFGLGDMVRIEVAPPKPTVAPVPAANAVVAKPVSITTVPVARPARVVATAPSQVAQTRPSVDSGLAKQQQRRVPEVNAAPVAKPVVEPAQSQVQQRKAAVVKTTAGKTAKKSVKRSKKHHARPALKDTLFRKKHGKQRYGCPKF
jgi:hypothetical protein